MKKRITRGLIALLAIVMCVATVQAQNPTSGQTGPLTWKYDTATKTLTISGKGEMPSYRYVEGTRLLPTTPWLAFKDELAHAIIEEGVTGISDYAFFELSELVSVNLPKSLLKIEHDAFFNCKKLPALTIPAGVKEIKDEAFFMCSALAAITVDTANTAYTSVDGVLFDKEKVVLNFYPDAKPDKAYSIPVGAKATTSYAFARASRLTSVTLPAGMLGVGLGAFAYCENLESVTLPDGFRFLNPYAFEACKNLKSITLLTKTPPLLRRETFKEVPVANVTLTVPKGAKAAYAAAPVWKEFKQIAESTVSNALLPEARIYTADGRLYLTLARAETVHIYNVSGALVRTFTAPAGETSVTLSQGVYVVRAGERTEKVAVE